MAKNATQRKSIYGVHPGVLMTQKWIAENVSSMHPGQVPVLMAELHSRGWTDDVIERRVAPHLLNNPFYEATA